MCIIMYIYGKMPCKNITILTIILNMIEYKNQTKYTDCETELQDKNLGFRYSSVVQDLSNMQTKALVQFLTLRQNVNNMLVIPELKRLRRENCHKFEATLT